MGVSASQPLNVTKLTHPHKTSVLQNLYDADCEAGLNFLNCSLQGMCARHINPTITLFSNGISLHLSGHANTQGNRYQAATNLMLIHKVLLNDIKGWVWRPVSPNVMIGTICFARP